MLLVFVFSSQKVQAQFKADSVFTCQAYLDDLDSLKHTLEVSHPNPYVFCGKDFFQQEFDRTRLSITDSTTLQQFALKVAELMAVLRDSHSSIDYSYLSQLLLKDHQHLLPFKIYSDSTGIFVERDRSKKLLPGLKIITIDHHHIDSLYSEVLKAASTEGDAVVGKHRIADAVFPTLVAMHSPLNKQADIEYMFQGSDSIYCTTVECVDMRRYRKAQKIYAEHEMDSLYKLKFGNGNQMAYLKIGSFAPSNRNQYRKFIYKSFEKINEKGCKNLILDIRDNGGGSSAWVEYLYSFLDSAGYNTPNNVISISSRIGKKRTAHMSKKSVKWVLEHFYKRDEDVQAFLRFYQNPLGKLDTVFFHQPTKQKDKLVFKGNCYLMINGLTASAGVDFTNSFKQHHRGPIVGEPCLGPISGTFGNPTSYSLPNTEVRVILATIRYNYDTTFVYERLPIQPDYWVPTRSMDLLKGKDTQLEFIESLILKK